MVVVQDFPSIIGERKRLCNEIERKEKLTKNSVFLEWKKEGLTSAHAKGNLNHSQSVFLTLHY